MQARSYKNIICYGEILWDMLPTGAVPGGAPLNVAIHLKKKGENPVLISKKGEDEDGDRLFQFITEAGLNGEFIQTDDKLPTSKVLIHLDKNRNATYEICEPVAWDNINWNNEIKKIAGEAELIIFGSLASRNIITRKTLLEMLDSTDAIRLLDVNLRPPYDNNEWIEKLLHLSDFVKLNDDELVKIASWNNKSGKTLKLLEWFSEFYQCPEICVTRGANGAILYTENTIYEHPGFKVNAVDTVGAGDSFLASLIANLSKNEHPQKALEHACATGAFVASQMGAVPNYTETDIQKIISSNR